MKKILLVEDDELVRDLYQEILEQEGFQVTTAHDGQKAFDLMSEGGFDLVLLDVMLPKLDGIQILERLNKQKLLKKNKKIVLLTNLSEEAVLKKKKRIHADGYIIKSSVDPGELLAKIKGFLKT